MNTTTHLNVEKQSILVIIDMQTALVNAMPTTEMHTVVTHSKRLIKAAQLLDIPILVTEQYPAGLGSTVAELAEVLPTNTLKFPKTVFSCCAVDDFMTALKTTERKQVIVIGMEAHVCVLQTVLELQRHGFEVYVNEDAIISRNPQNKANALHRMSQNNIAITNYESVILEWLRDAKHPSFKTISSWLKT
ncbi:MAG: isochorismatase family protein [Methylococcaceae bacterium]